MAGSLSVAFLQKFPARHPSALAPINLERQHEVMQNSHNLQIFIFISETL
jgi:hypothetical protein